MRGKMNEKFYSLPKEKQKKIIDAGFYVFSRNSYQKSPMSEIAAQAGISKSLLFYYFRNKKELYLFLWEEGARFTIDYLTKCGCYTCTDFFETLEMGMKAKARIMRQFPDLTAFVVKAFYERDPAVLKDIQESYQRKLGEKAVTALLRIEPSDFIPGVDLQMMYREMYWASEGYLWETLQRGDLDADRLEKDFMEMIAFWKQIYGRKEGRL